MPFFGNFSSSSRAAGSVTVSGSMSRGGPALLADDRAHVALHHLAQGLEHRLLQAVARGRAVVLLDQVKPVQGQIDRRAPVLRLVAGTK